MGGSPADEVGLRPGDKLLQADGKPVTSVEGFIESIEQKGPGTTVQLTLLRNGQQQQVEVELGDVSQAPMNFFRQAMRPPMNSPMGNMQDFQNMMRPMVPNAGGFGQDQQMLDQTIDDLRQRVRQLERQIQELTGQSGQSNAQNEAQNGSQESQEETQQQNQQEDQQPDPAEENSGEDAEADQPLGEQGQFRIAPQQDRVVAQQNRRDRDQRRDRDWDRNRNWDRDWDRDRDWGWNRGWDSDRRWGRDYDWRDRYESRYRDRLYYSPRYGNQYYRYNGRPYYYGNRSFGVNPYYGGSALRFGNFGLYWY